MRSMWKGSISFGLVTIPVQLYLSAEAAPIHICNPNSKLLAGFNSPNTPAASRTVMPWRNAHKATAASGALVSPYILATWPSMKRHDSRCTPFSSASGVDGISPWELESCRHSEHLSKARALLPLGSSTNREPIPTGPPNKRQRYAEHGVQTSEHFALINSSRRSANSRQEVVSLCGKNCFFESYAGCAA